MNSALNGGCQVPIACFALPASENPALQGETAVMEQLWLRGLVGSPDGLQMLSSEACGSDPRLLGEGVAQELLQQGAGGPF